MPVLVSRVTSLENYRITYGWPRNRVILSRPRLLLLSSAVALLIAGLLSLFYISHLIFFKSTVLNVSVPSYFIAENPAGFIEQSPQSTRLLVFRSELPTYLRAAVPTLNNAIKICHWVRKQQPDGASWRPRKIRLSDRLRGDLEDPLSILQAQRQGAPAVCRRFAYLLAGAAESTGMRARVVIVARTFWKSYVDGHVMTEIWIPDLKKWVLMDSMSDLMYTVGGRPASALEVHVAVEKGRSASVAALINGISVQPLDRALLERRFAHMYIALTNAFFDGYRVCFSCSREIRFAHLVDYHTAPYPQGAKRLGLYFGLAAILAGSALIAASRFVPWSSNGR